MYLTIISQVLTERFSHLFASGGAQWKDDAVVSGKLNEAEVVCVRRAVSSCLSAPGCFAVAPVTTKQRTAARRSRRGP